ncbi:hypothetical protein HAX54_017509, partial [Datura stramonium]|nr:hypothetical protein [Datura stramonium]
IHSESDPFKNEFSLCTSRTRPEKGLQGPRVHKKFFILILRNLLTSQTRSFAILVSIDLFIKLDSDIALMKFTLHKS